LFYRHTTRLLIADKFWFCCLLDLAIYVAYRKDSCMGKKQRFGIVIGIKPEAIEKYKALHADSESGVRDLLEQANIHNFSIFMHTLDDGQAYLFGYYEYTGDDYEADMARLDKDPRNLQWLEMCGALQKPLKGETFWANMEQVYFNR